MATLDCLIIGHNDGNFQQAVAKRKAMARSTGAYRDAQINSVRLHGQRLSYMQLFNQVVQQQDTGADEYSAFDPLGLAGLHLASYLHREGLSTVFVGRFRKGDAALDELLASEPLTIAITTTFYFEADPISEVVEYAARRAPSSVIVVGGPFPSQLERAASPDLVDATVKQTGADVVVVDSQGEATLARVVQALKQGGGADDLGVIPNLILNVDGRITHTPRDPEDNSVETNRIEWSLFDPGALRPLSMIRTALSCPFACSFCSYPIRAGEHRLASVECVEQDLRKLDALGVIYVYFVDDTFNVPAPRFKELCRMMIRNRFRLRWLSYLRCGNMDAEAVDLAAASGCVGALLGIESGDEGVLRLMNKYADPNGYRRAIRRLESSGIMTWALCFVGFPGDSERAVKNTIDLLNDASPSFYATQLWFYDRTTPIHRRAAEFGLTNEGYAWQHNSMSWQDGCGLVEQMLKDVKASQYVPQTGFSFETIFYLMGKGFDLGFLRSFLRIARDLTVASLGDVRTDESLYVRELERLCGRTLPGLSLDRVAPPATWRDVRAALDS